LAQQVSWEPEGSLLRLFLCWPAEVGNGIAVMRIGQRTAACPHAPKSYIP